MQHIHVRGILWIKGKRMDIFGLQRSKFIVNCKMKTYGHEANGTLDGSFYLFLDRTPNLNDCEDQDDMPQKIKPHSSQHCLLC